MLLEKKFDFLLWGLWFIILCFVGFIFNVIVGKVFVIKLIYNKWIGNKVF